MTIFKTFKRVALAGLIAVSFTACDSLVETEPKQSISSEVALTSLSGVQAVLTEVYDALQDVDYYGQYFMLYPEALADNIDITPENSNRYPNVIRNEPRSHLNRWGGHYESINLANNIIASIDDLDVAEETRNQIRGEALFLRALNYFDLVRTKAYTPGAVVGGFDSGVILRTEPTRSVDDADYRARATIDEVYAQIKADLQEAIALLEPATSADAKFRANEAAAQAMLAKVHLYAREWQQAADQATAALNTTNAVLTPNASYVAAFTDVSNPESLFEIQFESTNDGDATGFNESLNSLTLPTEDGISRWGDVIPSQDLLDNIEPGDVRADLYVEKVKSGTPFIYSVKWQDTPGNPNTVNVPVIRYSEVLLIRAEAYAELGQLGQAIADLNTIRERAGLEPLSTALSKQQVIDAVLQERRVEFALEGQRFFDLKRRGLDIPKPQSAEGTIPYSDYRILAPLPTGEIDQNDLLVQNPGY